MADKVGITDETVTAGLRRLLDGGVLALTALVDWTAAGYAARAYVRIRVSGRPANDVVKPLFVLDGMHVISETPACCDVVLSILAPDMPSLRLVVTDQIRVLDGITSGAVDVVTETCKHHYRATTSPMT